MTHVQPIDVTVRVDGTSMGKIAAW